MRRRRRTRKMVRGTRRRRRWRRTMLVHYGRTITYRARVSLSGGSMFRVIIVLGATAAYRC
jgi:hypothetical protein